MHTLTRFKDIIKGKVNRVKREDDQYHGILVVCEY